MSNEDIIDLEPVSESSKATDSEKPEGINGVVVIRREEDNGDITTDVQIIGDVKPTEVQTVLELAVPAWRAKIGLS